MKYFCPVFSTACGPELVGKERQSGLFIKKSVQQVAGATSGLPRTSWDTSSILVTGPDSLHLSLVCTWLPFLGNAAMLLSVTFSDFIKVLESNVLSAYIISERGSK